MRDGSSELRQLATSLGHVAGGALKDVDAVLKKGVDNMKREMVADVSDSEHFKGMAGAISYESHYLPGTAKWVVGPDKSRHGGGLGNIYYFGTSRGGGTGDIDKPLRSEEPKTLRALADLLDRWADRL
ncbi:hypothetical protein LJR013_003197 [Pseudarthrobacter oxydans]|uniref:hypothetical protein n=1 Tax=Pseudarthrobacter oxydans TaxID=1671 RepID=UPI003ECC2270